MSESNINKQIIELVKVHPSLYDQNHPEYTHKPAKTAVWKAIAKEVGISPVICKTKWYNIRDHFRRTLRQSLQRSDEPVSNYRYADSLQFMRNCFKDIKTVKSDEDSNPEESVVEEDDFEPEIKLELDMPPKKKAKKRQNIETVVFENPCNDFANYEESGPGSSFVYSQPVHPVDAFLAAICPTLKNLSAYNLSLAKSEIFTTVQKYEMKTLMEETPYDIGHDQTRIQEAKARSGD